MYEGSKHGRLCRVRSCNESVKNCSPVELQGEIIVKNARRCILPYVCNLHCIYIILRVCSL